jgi:hypothetical protein
VKALLTSTAERIVIAATVGFALVLSSLACSFWSLALLDAGQSEMPPLIVALFLPLVVAVLLDEFMASEHLAWSPLAVWLGAIGGALAGAIFGGWWLLAPMGALAGTLYHKGSWPTDPRPALAPQNNHMQQTRSALVSRRSPRC